MATRKTPTTKKTTRTRTSVADLEKRLKALERRVAILEAKLPQPTLAERMAESTPSGRRGDLAQDQ